MKAFSLNIANAERRIQHIEQEDNELRTLVNNHSELFDEELGCYKHKKIHLKVGSDVKPIFVKPRPVAFALKEAVDKELAKLENSSVIPRVTNSDWGTPLVPMMRENDKFRLCGD